MQNMIISIPKPCHEDWDKMSVEERGRFCGKCCKTVVDFSNKTSSEVQQYVSTHQNEKLCGHFSNDQLSQSVTIQRSDNFAGCNSTPLKQEILLH